MQLKTSGKDQEGNTTSRQTEYRFQSFRHRNTNHHDLIHTCLSNQLA